MNIAVYVFVHHSCGACFFWWILIYLKQQRPLHSRFRSMSSHLEFLQKLLSSTGGVRCLSILNATFAIIFGLLALILGSTLLTLGSSCSLPLFWCYEIASWGLVVLYGGTAFLLRRKTAVFPDENDFAGRNIGLEMLEINPVEVTPQVERRVNEGFKSWMGPSFLSSDEEDESDDYQEMPNLTNTISSKQCV
ncbi:uncharacterized protein LOC111374860 isoform X1 [Olea europaea var. sylvestris]|uniref:uncharacterized protein LOC111374860 isoform X1 n=2 Tax=Olea europaea var. sylvestris TaxID=158386 RepID=UPI000C1CCF49|nr:uncharacterized protein LOC111374860 isoform X1 [Olea europaea var. sylvestris]